MSEVKASTNSKTIKIITHNRRFHLDEVIAHALVEMFYLGSNFQEKTRFNFKTIRTRDDAVINSFKDDDDAFIIDVGFEYNQDKKILDHHQRGFAEKWPDGKLMSSCGLVWKYLKDKKHLSQKMNQEMITYFEEKLIKRVDDHDNGVATFDELFFILMYNRNHDNEDVMTTQYMNAVRVAKEYIYNLLSIYRAEKEKEKINKKMTSEYNNSPFIIMEKNSHKNKGELAKTIDPTGKILKFIAAPHSKDKFIVYGVNNAKMPTELRGKKDLVVDGFSLDFCHANGYMCIINANKDTLKKFLGILTNI